MLKNIRLTPFEGMTINRMCRRLSADAMQNHTTVFVGADGIRIEYPSMELCRDWHGGETIAEMRMYLFDADTAKILIDGKWRKLPQPAGEYTFYVEVRRPIFEVLIVSPLLNFLSCAGPTALPA